MIYIFHGDDSIDSFLSVKKKIIELTQKNFIPVENIDGEDITISNIISYTENVDMFSSTKLYFVKRFLREKSNRDGLSEIFNKINDSEVIIMFWEDEKIDGRSKILSQTKRGLNEFIFDLPKERDLVNLVLSKTKENGITLKTDQAEFVLEIVGTSKGVILKEIDKLVIYSQVKNLNNFSNELLKDILTHSIQTDLWSFLKFFGKRDKKNLYTELNKLLKYEDNTQLIMAMISRELRIYSQIKFCNKNKITLSEIKLHPFVLKKAIENVKNFSDQDILTLSKKLIELDFSIKTGRIDEQTGIVLYLSIV